MAKKNFTPSQRAILDALENEFISINTTKVKPNGLIDVGMIKKEVEEKNNFLREIDLANKSFREFKFKQMLSDIESIGDDLDALGLKVYRPNDANYYFFIVAKNFDEKKMDVYRQCYVYVRYKDTHHIKKFCNDLERHVNSKYGVKLDNQSFGTIYATFIDAINSDNFKEGLKHLYETTLR